jgi:hypothetical protein
MRRTPDYATQHSVCAGFLAFLGFAGHTGLVQRKGWCTGTLLWRVTVRLLSTAVSDALLLRPVAVRLLLLLLLILLHLGLLGGQDAEVMLGVLQIVLCHHAIAGRVRVARKLKILLVDMCRRAANLYLRPVRVERAVRIVTAASTTAAAMADMAAVISLRPAAAST